jgi:hypothetical protein
MPCGSCQHLECGISTAGSDHFSMDGAQHTVLETTLLTRNNLDVRSFPVSLPAMLTPIKFVSEDRLGGYAEYLRASPGAVAHSASDLRHYL